MKNEKWTVLFFRNPFNGRVYPMYWNYSNCSDKGKRRLVATKNYNWFIEHFQIKQMFYYVFIYMHIFWLYSFKCIRYYNSIEKNIVYIVYRARKNIFPGRGRGFSSNPKRYKSEFYTEWKPVWIRMKNMFTNDIN